MLKKYEDDLEFYIKTLEEHQVDTYHTVSKDELLKIVEEYKSTHEIETDYEFIYFLKYITKKLNGLHDEHTNIRLENYSYLPLDVRFIDNDLYITNCQDEKFKFQKIIGINGVDMNTIINELEKVISYNTNSWLLSFLEDHLKGTESILFLPCMKGKNEIVYNTTIGDLSFENKIYTKKDLKFLEEKENYQIDVDNEIVIFTYNVCRELEENEMKNAVEKLKEIVEKNNINKFVLDLRKNKGGNSRIIKPLIEYLDNSDLELYTLIDRRVFSSGRLATADMQKIGSVIIGEEIGDAFHCYGDTYVFELPNTNIKCNCTWKYIFIDNGYYNQILKKEDLEKLTEKDFELQNIIPDIYVTYNLEDLKNGNDSFLQAVYENIYKNSKM